MFGKTTEPYPGWHCVFIEEWNDGTWLVRCHPHGVIAHEDTHLAAFKAAVEHDSEAGPCAVIDPA